jgi:hypothetical protein
MKDQCAQYTVASVIWRTQHKMKELEVYWNLTQSTYNDHIQRSSA